MSRLPVLVWSGEARNKRGRLGSYRVVARPDLAEAYDVAEITRDCRRILTVEKCFTDAMGAVSWRSVGRDMPRCLLVSLVLELVEAKGGAA